MSTNDQFDELARRKLAERDFPFQEAHWLDAQRAIAAQGQQRRGGAWLYIAGVAALIVAIWLLWPTGQAVQVTEVNNVRAQHPVEADAAVVANKNEQDAAANAVASNTDGSVAQVEAQAGSSTSDGAQQRSAVEQAQRNFTGTRQGEPQRKATPTNGDGPAAKPANGRPNADLANQGPATPTPAPSASNDLNAATDDDAALLAAHMNATKVDQGTTNGSKPASGTDGTLNAAGGGAIDGADATDGSLPNITPGSDGSADGLPVIDPDQGIAADHPTDPLAADTGSVAGSDPADSAAHTPDPLPVIAPEDTASAAPQPPAVPPLITPRSPWEITALGGLFNTTSTYSGGNSAAWSVDPQQTIGFGAEYVHMGRNVGLGGGIHYGTYADRLRTPEESRSVLTTTPSWYLQPVDTTILIITDTYTDSLGVVHYVGQNIDVTINELRMTLDSSYANTVIRQASERINRTSYVEVVGLADAHLVQGRWSFGVRGGPSFGLLTQHRGSIPSGEDGYIEFTDLPMKTFVMGWTARAYVRYRFNAAWSVGIEPTARGQFNVAFDQEGVTRRSSALGCMLSITYRLR